LTCSDGVLHIAGKKEHKSTNYVVMARIFRKRKSSCKHFGTVDIWGGARKQPYPCLFFPYVSDGNIVFLIFIECLFGRPPFVCSSMDELIEEIKSNIPIEVKE